VIKNTDYLIVVDGKDGATGAVMLGWSSSSRPRRRTTIRSRSTISGNSGTLTASNVNGTIEAGEPKNANVTGGASILVFLDGDEQRLDADRFAWERQRHKLWVFTRDRR